MDKLSMLDAVDGAHYVFVNEDAELMYVWHGGAIVNIYNTWTFECVDCFTRTKRATKRNPNGYLSREEIHDAIQLHITCYTEMGDD